MATDFRSLQRNFLGALPLGFEGVKTLAMQKLKNKEITPLVDVPVQPPVNTGGKLLNFCGCLLIFKRFERAASHL